MLDMMRDDKSRYEQLLCQMPDEEAVTHQIGSTLSGTWITPGRYGGELWHWQSAGGIHMKKYKRKIKP